MSVATTGCPSELRLTPGDSTRAGETVMARWKS